MIGVRLDSGCRIIHQVWGTNQQQSAIMNQQKHPMSQGATASSHAAVAIAVVAHATVQGLQRVSAAAALPIAIQERHRVH